jgi:hypothetical protein
MTLRQRLAVSFGFSLLAFATDWSGYDKWNPSLFHPKRFADVWWHFPALLVGIFIASLLIWRGDGPRRFGL